MKSRRDDVYTQICSMTCKEEGSTVKKETSTRILSKTQRSDDHTRFGVCTFWHLSLLKSCVLQSFRSFCDPLMTTNSYKISNIMIRKSI